MKLNSAGIELSDAHLVPWSEILAVHVIEVDTITAPVAILQFEHESGHYLEIHELDDAFSSALQDLASFLPLDETWMRVTQGLEPRTSATIWKR